MNTSFFEPEIISLDGFKVVKQTTIERVVPTLTLFNDGLSFSTSSIKALNACEYILLMINKENKSILVKPVISRDENALRWCNPEKIDNRKISSKVFMEEVFDLMNWSKRSFYRTNGRYVIANNSPCLLFELKKAWIQERKAKK